MGRVMSRTIERAYFPGDSSTVANAFDAQMRLAGFSNGVQAANPTEFTTYTAWDAKGRPTAGTFTVRAVTTCLETARDV